MRTETFQNVLHGAARLGGLDPSRDFGNQRASALAEYINERVREGWEHEFWPEWTPIEQRQYRDAYATGTYAAPTATVAVEVWFPPAQKYYQTLRASTSQAPATLTGGVYVENSAYWAECAATYAAADWLTGTVYAAGVKVRYPDDNRFYQCHTAHTAGATFDATKFGVLTPFSRYVAYEQTGKTVLGEMSRATRRDPRVRTQDAWDEPFALSELGVQFHTSAPNEIWLTFRRRVPVFTSVPYSSTTTYGAAGLLVFWPGPTQWAPSLTGTGECYKSKASMTVGTLPSDTTKWEKVNFPYALVSFVKRAVYSDLLREQKQTDRAKAELNEATDKLTDAAVTALEQQGQFEQAAVRTYGAY